VSSVTAYFSDIYRGLSTALVGMSITLRYLFSRPVTEMYPDVKPMTPTRYRGVHVFEEEKCIGCYVCAKACPVECIEIGVVRKGKEIKITRFDIDYQKCMFCDLCCEPCPAHCIHMGPEFEKASFTRKGTILRFATPKSLTEEEKKVEKVAKK